MTTRNLQLLGCDGWKIVLRYVLVGGYGPGFQTGHPMPAPTFSCLWTQSLNVESTVSVICMYVVTRFQWVQSMELPIAAASRYCTASLPSTGARQEWEGICPWHTIGSILAPFEPEIYRFLCFWRVTENPKLLGHLWTDFQNFSSTM